MTVSSMSRALRVAATSVVIGTLLTGSGARAVSITCQSWGAQPPNASPHNNYLTGLVAISNCDAWAVGAYSNGSSFRTLVEHWNGATWTIKPSPNVGSGDNFLQDVAADAPTDAWAVGFRMKAGVSRTLVEQWNGTTWATLPSPNVGVSRNQLHSVTAISPANAWAVGFRSNSAGVSRTLIEHWNGASWQVQPSPDAGALDNRLQGIATASAKSVWAVGSHFNGSADQTLIEHWNGTSWKVQPSPIVGPFDNGLNDVAATSASDAWAVGVRWTAGDVARTLIEHWNGSSWTIGSSPNIGTVQDQLIAVAATSSTNAWAVGFHDTNGGVARTLIEHWNGTTWAVQPSLNVGSNDNFLQDVSANSPRSAWTVGYHMKGTVARTLAFHCC